MAIGYQVKPYFLAMGYNTKNDLIAHLPYDHDRLLLERVLKLSKNMSARLNVCTKFAILLFQRHYRMLKPSHKWGMMSLFLGKKFKINWI